MSTTEKKGVLTTKSLDTEGERGNIQQEDISDVAREDTSLNRSANSDRLIRVDTLTRLPPKDSLDGLHDPRHTSHTTNKDDLVDLRGLDSRIGQCLLARIHSPLDERGDEGLELRSKEFGVDVLRPRGVGGDEGEVDFRLSG